MSIADHRTQGRIAQIFVCAFLAVSAMHAGTGINSLKRFVWLLKRNSQFESDVAKLRRSSMRYSGVVATLREQTPHDAVLVIQGSRALAYEAAFYAFPRRVIWRQVDDEDGCRSDQASISGDIGGGMWSVTQACGVRL